MFETLGYFSSVLKILIREMSIKKTKLKIMVIIFVVVVPDNYDVYDDANDRSDYNIYDFESFIF